jgi:hypothetical protein
MPVRIAVSDPLPVYRHGVMATLGEAGFAPEAPDDLLRWIRQEHRLVVLLTLDVAVGLGAAGGVAPHPVGCRGGRHPDRCQRAVLCSGHLGWGSSGCAPRRLAGGRSTSVRGGARGLQRPTCRGRTSAGGTAPTDRHRAGAAPARIGLAPRAGRRRDRGPARRAERLLGTGHVPAPPRPLPAAECRWSDRSPDPCPSTRLALTQAQTLCRSWSMRTRRRSLPEGVLGMASTSRTARTVCAARPARPPRP